MRLVDISICVDNKDPLQLGRIRTDRASVNSGYLVRAYDYKKWDYNDPFVANPFLPNSINHIPEIGQACKVITYDASKDLVNMEYIAGPFNTMFDYNKQIYADMVNQTTFGNSGKRPKDIVNPEDGSYINSKSYGSFAKPEHHAIYGMYGSDVLFTDNGVNLRGGKFPTKESASTEEKNMMVNQPIMAENVATLHLKKFPQLKELVDEPSTKTITETGQLKYLIEYEVDDLSFTGTTNIHFRIYDTTNAGDNFRIENNYLDQALIDPNITSVINLVSLQNTQPNNKDYSIVYTANTLDDTYQLIRNKIKDFNIIGFKAFGDTSQPKNITHPFYFRPTQYLKNFQLTGTELENRKTLYSSIIVGSVLIGQGLVFSKEKFGLPIRQTTDVQQIIKVTGEKSDNTFASLKSDKMYFLSSNTNLPTNITNGIDFNIIDKYEPSHTNYVEDIHPNTYASVRGEVLVQILNTMFNLFMSHQHQPTEPLVQDDKNFQNLKRLIETLENDMLNKSIRIN